MVKTKTTQKCVNVDLSTKDWAILDTDAKRERRSRNRYVEHLLAEKAAQLREKQQKKSIAA